MLTFCPLKPCCLFLCMCCCSSSSSFSSFPTPFVFPLHLRLEKCFTRHLKTAFLLFLTNDRSARLTASIDERWMNKGCVSVCTCMRMCMCVCAKIKGEREKQRERNVNASHAWHRATGCSSLCLLIFSLFCSFYVRPVDQ